MSKEKFDLSNVGGKPKTWAERGSGMQDDSGWLEDLKMTSGCLGIALLLLVPVAALVYGLFKIAGKI